MYGLPFDEAALLDEIGGVPVVTVEEHIVRGGIGSAVLEAVNAYGRNNQVTRLGIDFGDGYPHTSGSREYFMRQYGLTAEDIIPAVRAACGING